MVQNSWNSTQWGTEYTKEGTVDYKDFPFLENPWVRSWEFENFHTVKPILEYMQLNKVFPLIIANIYIIAAFGLQHWMKSRPALELKWLLFFWNLSIGIFSIVGFIRTVPDFIYVLSQPDGFYKSICLPGSQSERYWYWGVMFSLSKLIELVDTGFVVLRKRPLEAVQWYHHAIMVIATWMCAPYLEPYFKYVVVFNYGVHGIMYPYFALKVARFKVPMWFTKLVTSCQYTQMVTNMIANLVSAYYYLTGTRYCYRHSLSLFLIIAINITFVYMFGKLFVTLVLNSTLRKPPVVDSKKIK